MKRFRWVPFVWLIGLISVSAAIAQEKKALPIEDYKLWRSIRSTAISDQGDWVAYAYSERKKDDQLFLVHLDSDKKYEIPRGTRPQFSDDSKFAVCVIVPTVEKGGGKAAGGQRGGSAGDAAPKSNQAQLMDLESGKKRTWDDVTSVSFSKGSRVLVVRKRATDRNAKHRGTDLILRYLDKGYEELIGSVGTFAFNKEETLLVYTVDAVDQNGNGVYLINLTNGHRRPLDNGKATYAQLTWAEESDALAVLKGSEDKEYEHRENVLLAFTGLEGETPTRHEFNSSEAYGFPRGMVISQLGSLSWSEDLTKVFFSIKQQEKKAKPQKDAEAQADVDVWHWKDDRIQSVQKIMAGMEKNRTDRAVYHLAEKKFVRLTDPTMASIGVTRDGKWGIGQDDRAYVSDWKQRRADYYRVNTLTGERTLFLEGHLRTMGLSPHSSHFLYWKDGHVWAHVLDSGESINLTEKSDVSFENVEFDYVGERPPYGVTGWSEDGQSVVLAHRYDLYAQPLDGSKATCLTQGAGSADSIRLRYVRTDPEERTIDLSKPMLLSAYGQWTKKSGYYRLADGNLEPLIFKDKMIGRVNKAKSAGKMMFTIQSFSEYPDYYVSDDSFAEPKRLTDANPHQKNYRWGKRILFDFTNSKGVRLQGTLGIPDDYQEGEKLPMLVNFYEKNSQNLHRYPTPRYSSGPQFAGYVSNRYLVMQPDIHFNTGTSHSDMLECVEAAVTKVIEMGYADPKRIGLHGHSYSGGGSAFIATRSKMFAAIVAGAAPINLVSEFNQLFRGSGQNNHQYDIHGQGRYGTNPYDDFELYWEQSPISGVRTMDTPLLYLHGTSDMIVEYLQGMEFYNALRFNNKPIIFLSYPGEGHGLRRYENQIDFQRRVRQFYEHHLNGKVAPAWMVKGVPYLNKKKN